MTRSLENSDLIRVPGDLYSFYLWPLASRCGLHSNLNQPHRKIVSSCRPINLCNGLRFSETVRKLQYIKLGRRVNVAQNASWLEQYTWALFKALSHMLCIGFGRYPPQSTTDVWLTIVSMLTGATCYALFVGHTTTVIQSFDTSRRLYREKVSLISTYTSWSNVSTLLRESRIRIELICVI